MRLGMHDMLQEMGKNIVIHESLDAGKRSRLWLQEDIDHILTNNKGSEFIQGIVLDSLWSFEASWHPEAFSKTCNIRLLMLKYPDLMLGVNCLPEGLKYLEWEKFPLKELPLGFQLNELVELIMHRSKIQEPWHGIKYFGKLKLIDLEDSKDLIRFPSVSGIPHLERLVLQSCINLIEVDQSIGVHKKLMVLNLRNCAKLKVLPRKLEMDSLKELVLSGCSKFSRLPENLDENEALEALDVSGTAIREVPDSIVHLKYLKRLSFGGRRDLESNSWNLSLPFLSKFCKRPVSTGMMLPAMASFSYLESLNLSYCNLSDESLPAELGFLSSLGELDLSGNNFINLPSRCFANLSKLYSLKLDCCPRLQSIPMPPPSVEWLHGRNSASWNLFSDPQFLCDYFSSRQLMESLFEPFLIIPGNEIPTWFSNQNFFHLDIQSPFNWEVISESGFIYINETISPISLDSFTSIMVDIPHDCLSSEWWGIAVCLVFENQCPDWFGPSLRWICKTPEAELPIPSGKYRMLRIEDFSYSHLCILLLRGNDRNIQRHLRSDQSQLQLLFYADAMARDGEMDYKFCSMNISKCGCRVLSKEDLEVWSKAMDERKQSSNFEIPSSSLSKSRLREIVDDNQCCDGFEGEFASTSNAEAKRRKLG
ncbi:hypothetical protein L6164_031630 [Bauhinia variegata]|nr:hypothetical protein L6164_031630 [Bauhinia variegata]